MTNERRAAALPLLSCMLLAIFISGCSTMLRVDLESGESLLNLVEHGDEVKVTTHNYEVVEFVVAGIDDDVIVGNEQTILRGAGGYQIYSRNGAFSLRRCDAAHRNRQRKLRLIRCR